MTVLLASIDPGNAISKGYRGPQYGPIFFPSRVAVDRRDGFRNFQGFSSVDPLIIQFDGAAWAVGHSAEDVSRYTREAVGYTRYDSPEFSVLVAALLAELYPQRGGQVALAFSLPVDAFGLAEVQRERFAGTWTVGRGGRNLTFELVPDLMIPVPEAFGSLCYFLLSKDGRSIVDYDLAESRVAIFDIGGFTTDLLTFRHLDLQPVRASIERGVINVRRDVNEQLKRRFNRSGLATRDIDTILEPADDGRNYYTHAGQPMDITDIVETATAELASSMLRIWEQDLNSGLDYDAVIFTGGGSPFLRPYLERQIRHGNILRVPDDEAHLANAIGAWRFAAYRLE